MTLQSTLDSLVLLSREHEADLLTTIELAHSGASLTVHWTPMGDALPRECTLFFDAEGENPDAFLWSVVVAPELWLHAVDEGMSFPAADDISRRMVEHWRDVETYLLGVAPYEWVKAKTEATS